MTSRAAIYARYSTDNQSARSVADQIALCEAFAARSGLAVAARFSDSAVSGQTMQRPGFAALMRAVRSPAAQRGFDVLIVEHSDRLTRHPGDIHDIREAFAFAGVAILQVDGGELDAMKAAVSGLVSSLTLKANTEKTIRGMNARAVQGLRMGGRLYGYAPVRGEAGRIAVVPEQAAVVRRIFALFIAGHSPRAIAARLNGEGIPGPRGPRWAASSIAGWGKRGNGILGNEAYCGVVIWNKVKMWRDPETRKRVSRPNPPAQWIRVSAPDLAIIDAETFAAAQARRNGPAPVARPRHARHLLSGLLRCPCCGGGLSVKDGRGEARRVICTTFRESGACRSATPYNLARIERAVVARLRNELEQPDLIRIYVEEFNRARRERRRSAAGGAAAYRAELARVSADLDRAAQAVISGAMAAATAAPHIARLETRRAELEALLRRAAEAREPVVLDIGATALFRRQIADLATVVATAQAAGDTELAGTFRQLVTRVTVHPNYELDIVGDLAPLVGGGPVVAGEGFERSPPAPVTVIPFIMKAAA